MPRFRSASLVAPLVLALASAASWADPVPEWLRGREAGPFPMRVLHVSGDGRVLGVAQVDGTALPSWWRIHGLELPRTGAGAACDDERSRADAAARSILSLTREQPLQLTQVAAAPDDHHLSGRILLSDGRDLADVLVRVGLARPPGGTMRDPWCGW